MASTTPIVEAFVVGTVAFAGFTSWSIRTQGRADSSREESTYKRSSSRRPLPTIHVVVYGRVRFTDYELPEAYSLATRDSRWAERTA
jgi:hypothetical protein